MTSSIGVWYKKVRNYLAPRSSAGASQGRVETSQGAFSTEAPDTAGSISREKEAISQGTISTDAPETAKSNTITMFNSGSAKMVTVKKPSAAAVSEAEAKLRAEAYSKLFMDAALQAQSRRSRFRSNKAQGEEEVDPKN
ncbi:hypothetical protein MMC30_008336 [Trapelia coarctata]|nr:hypothetical protein [Trapelia coarctata]